MSIFKRIFGKKKKSEQAATRQYGYRGSAPLRTGNNYQIDDCATPLYSNNYDSPQSHETNYGGGSFGGGGASSSWGNSSSGSYDSGSSSSDSISSCDSGSSGGSD